MKRIPVSENFFLDEFIDPETYAARGARSIELIDKKLIDCVQYLRDHLGPLTINNWARKGPRRLSGTRPAKTKVGAKWSQHKRGHGLDIISPTLTPKEIHAFILSKEKMFIEKGWITVLEHLDDTPTWTHLDNRYTGLDRILIVRA
jgi:hypothetical protein